MLRINAWDRLLKSKHDDELLIRSWCPCGDEGDQNGGLLLGLPPADEERIMKNAVEFVPRASLRLPPTDTERTDANLDAAQARPIVSSAPIRKLGWSQRYVALRVRQEIHERQDRAGGDPNGCDDCTSTPRERSSWGCPLYPGTESEQSASARLASSASPGERFKVNARCS